MYKIGVIGDRDGVSGFLAVGFSVFEADSAETATRHLRQMARSGDYGVILIAERFAAEMEEAIGAYRDKPIPAIVTVPDGSGAKGADKKKGFDLTW